MNNQQLLLNEFLDQWQKGEGIRAHTSGSTGKPKDIILSQQQVERSAMRSIRFFGITSASRLHSAMSFEFIGGKMMIARSLMARCVLTFSKPAVELLPPEHGRKISLMSLVPAQMHYVLQHLEDFGDVEKFLIGGSAIDDKLWDRIIESGVEAWESYGMTETATHIAMRRIKGSSSSRPHFVPLLGVEISTNPFGCLKIKDGEVEITTTDLAKIYPNNSFEIIGRRDDIIITGGLKVMPQDIEKKMAPYLSPLCGQFYVSSLPDPVWTSRLVLVATPFPASSKLSDEQLKLNISENLKKIPEDILPKRLKPKEVRILQELPTTKSGKLNRRYKLEEEE